jgi:hopanoid biosynthesis associated radical SAM protein HpnH
MRFPLSLTRSMTAYLLRKKLAGQEKFPMVLMLEPLHACNLSCAGCGRIREYADTVQNRLSLRQCLSAVDECGAPIVSICGGEPLIYPDIEALVGMILAQRKHVYLCTNGVLLEKKLPGLATANRRLMINVHLDGMEATHDQIVGRPGVFNTAIAGIRAAKAAGFRVCTNTTIYQTTDMHEIVTLFEYLSELGVDGLMVSPAYGYEAVQQADPDDADGIFMTRRQVHEKFRQARQHLDRFRLAASPVYLDFLCGQRSLPCAAWANPTYNIRGWRGPCYLVADKHYKTYQDLIRRTDWQRFGPDTDIRCEHCLVHYGFEPSAVMAAQTSLRDIVRMAVWQMS